ncbi:MAG TPA: glycosyltransferase family 1 protein [Armatimonadota bacterium]|jgi:glycosyltransferase involved in cell wall biosynthesis
MDRYARSIWAELPDLGWDPQLVFGRSLPTFGPRSLRLASAEFSRHALYPVIARRRRSDVFHVTDHSFGHLVLALPAERTVVTCHDLMPWLVPEIFSRRIGRAIGLPLWERSVRAMKLAGHVVCVSECTRRDVLERIGLSPERTSVIPNGVSSTFHALPSDDRTAVRHRLGFPDDACVVLHVGHCQPYKNAVQVVRVVARLGQMGIRAVLLKVGGVTDEFLAAAADTRVELHRLTGISDDALNEAYNAADAMVFPSTYEGFGLPPLEAMRAGLPVVVSDTPALVEVTRGFAPAFPRDDVDGMAQAVRGIWEARDCRDANTDAARRMAEGYTWRAAAEQLAAIYERLAG